MKKLLLISIASLFISQSAFAESFTYKKGETYFASSLYWSKTKPDYTTISFDNGLAFEQDMIKTDSQRFAQTFDIQYGWRDDLSLFTKFDVGVEKYKLYLQYDNATLPTQFFEIDNYYARVLPELGFRKRLYGGDDKVLSNQWTYFPGDIIFSQHKSYSIHRNNAIETRLQYAQKFNTEFFWSKYFKDYKNPDLSHYFEWETGVKFYPEAKHFEIPLDLRVYFAAGVNWGFELAMYNTFNKYNFDSKPFNNNLIAANVNSLAGLAADDKLSVLNQIEGLRKTESSNTSHQLNFKVDYYLTRLQTVGTELSTNIINEKAFKNTTVMLNYSVYF